MRKQTFGSTRHFGPQLTAAMIPTHAFDFYAACARNAEIAAPAKIEVLQRSVKNSRSQKLL